MRTLIRAALGTALIAAGWSVEGAAINPAFVPATSGIIDDNASTPNSPVNLGMLFTPSANISVNALGFYNDPFNSFISAGETVAIYDASGALVTDVAVPNSGTLVGGYYWKSITPVTLTAGQQYTVDAFTGNNGWAYGGATAPTANSQISYDGQKYIYVNNLQFPVDTVAHAPTAYYGPNFSIGTSTVPDGGTTVMMLGLGLAGLAGLRRKFS